MERSSRVAFAYALAFFGFLVLPAAFRSQAPWPFPEGLYWQEVLDLLTPLVLIPLSWSLCGLGDEPTSRRVRILFLVLAAIWVEGQAMHLAANSIGRPLEDALTPVAALAHFYDEVLSHYLWHLGIDGIWAMAIIRSLAHPYRSGRLPRVLALPAAVVLGLAWFAVVIESGTWPLDLPFTAAALAYVLAGGLVRGRRRLEQAPVAGILGGAFALSLTLTAAWALYWAGLPQFTEVGWL